jgi:BMFP domain-containing protein YqiC
MQTENKLFDDFARLASGAASVFAGAKAEMESLFRQQFEQFLSNLNLVTREEFEVVQAMVVKARDEQEAILERLTALEADRATPKKSAKSDPESGSVSE